MITIRVKNLLIRTIIGLNPEERENKQDVIINIEIDVDSAEAAATDAPNAVVDYKVVTKRVIQMVQESKFYLLEKLTHEVLKLIMGDEKVLRCKVIIDKPHALRFAESVSVEMEEARQPI